MAISTHSIKPITECKRRRTHVVLRGNGAVEVGVQEGELLEDVAAHTGNLAEHEESGGTGEDTEGSSKGTTIAICEHNGSIRSV